MTTCFPLSPLLPSPPFLPHPVNTILPISTTVSAIAAIPAAPFLLIFLFMIFSFNLFFSFCFLSETVLRCSAKAPSNVLAAIFMTSSSRESTNISSNLAKCCNSFIFVVITMVLAPVINMIALTVTMAFTK